MEQKENFRATPLARKLAKDLQINLADINPSGPQGRILVSDVEKCANQKKSTVELITNNSQNSQLTTSNSQNLTFEIKPMTAIRKATAKAMTFSHQNNAAFTGMHDLDITATVEMRNQLKSLAEKQNVKLTYLAFIVKATALALKAMPNINVQIDESQKAIRYLQNVNIGIAVDTPHGLMVPVIKSADQLSIFAIANKIIDLAQKARDKKLTLAEMNEGTFTISNFGTVGLDYATPIINSPESAILGVGTMTKQPRYDGDQIKPCFIMPFSVTADHRIIDGADAGRFLMKIEAYLKNPLELLI